MFVDASAMVAILMREAGGEALAAKLDDAVGPVTSAIAIFEAVIAIRRMRGGSVAQARMDVRDFMEAARIQTVPITPEDGDAALEAFARFGKGKGHPAQLNMGDCFAYAVTRNRRMALLFKGDTFSRTDLAQGP